MTAVFNAPVLTIVFQDLFGGGQFRSFAGDAVRDYIGLLPAFSVTDCSFNFEYLFNMRKTQIFIKLRGCPDFPGFFTAMIGLVLGYVIRLPVDIFEK